MNEDIELVIEHDRYPVARSIVASYRGDKLGLIYDALRFARDNFRDENGLEFSNEETATLQEVIDVLEEHIQPEEEPAARHNRPSGCDCCETLPCDDCKGAP
ncbi:MAG TPA: hypothetical protein VGQ76_16005 [Thermoanaerobaculia bacterium]|jgi:hypothetical protein|nr:hypothetical protein [Thermoanaerobaculia bacterium]